LLIDGEPAPSDCPPSPPFLLYSTSTCLRCPSDDSPETISLLADSQPSWNPLAKTS
jgi:hypothetical protein